MLIRSLDPSFASRTALFVHVKWLPIKSFPCHNCTYATSHQQTVVSRTQFLEYPPDVRATLHRHRKTIASSRVRIDAKHWLLIVRYQLRG